MTQGLLPYSLQRKHVMLSERTVARIRNFKKSNPTYGAMSIKKCLALKASTVAIDKIVNNVSHYDPAYETPWLMHSKEKPRPWHDSKVTKRKPSIECPTRCPLCGMGFETEAEALDCCKRAVKEA